MSEYSDNDKDQLAALEHELELYNLTPREKQIARISAEIAARYAVRLLPDKLYQEVGKTVVKRFFMLVGAIFLGWAISKGLIKSPF